MRLTRRQVGAGISRSRIDDISARGATGLARWNLSGRADSSLFDIDHHGTDFGWGVGAQTRS